MKKFILIFTMFFCFASGFAQSDSVIVMQKLQQLELVNNQTKVLLKKSEEITKKKACLMNRLIDYIFHLKKENRLKQNELVASQRNNDSGIKPSNINEPVVEFNVPDGVDSIRGSFIYRLFHQNHFILKPYKIVNNEKIYLD